MQQPQEEEHNVLPSPLAPRLEKIPHTWWIEELLRRQEQSGGSQERALCPDPLGPALGRGIPGKLGPPVGQGLVWENDKIPKEKYDCAMHLDIKALDRLIHSSICPMSQRMTRERDRDGDRALDPKGSGRRQHVLSQPVTEEQAGADVFY